MSRVSREAILLLKEALKKEFPTKVITESLGSSNDQILTLNDGSPATTEENALIRMVQKSYSGFPTPSLASTEDGRSHLLQLVVEESGTSGVSVWSDINQSKLMARITEVNMDVELYFSDNGDVPAETDITSSKLKGVIRADSKHANAGN